MHHVILEICGYSKTSDCLTALRSGQVVSDVIWQATILPIHVYTMQKWGTKSCRLVRIKVYIKYILLKYISSLRNFTYSFSWVHKHRHYIEKRALFPQREWKKWVHAIGEGVGRRKKGKREEKKDYPLEGRPEDRFLISLNSTAMK